jgi:hypothetical protein
MSRRTYRDCALEELDPCPMNLYIYAVHVLKGRLPDWHHEKMVSFLESDPENAFVAGYLKFIKKETIIDRVKRFFGYA